MLFLFFIEFGHFVRTFLVYLQEQFRCDLLTFKLDLLSIGLELFKFVVEIGTAASACSS